MYSALQVGCLTEKITTVFILLSEFNSLGQLTCKALHKDLELLGDMVIKHKFKLWRRAKIIIYVATSCV